jgi:CBS domain-containing protein
MCNMDIVALLKGEALKNLVLKNPLTVEENTPLSEVVGLMQKRRMGCATVLKKEQVIGIFTERDYIRKVLPGKIDVKKPIQKFMTRDPHVLTPQDSVADAIELMNQYGHRHIPLVDSQKCFAQLISVRAIISYLSEHFPKEVYNLPPHPHRSDKTPEGG